MRYYPAFLDLLEQPCLVIGQGQLADEKAAQLEQAGAHVLRSSHFNKTQAKQVLLIVAALENEKHFLYFMDQLKNPKRSTFFFNEYFKFKFL